MAIIEMYGYVIKGSTVSNPCSATLGDKIEAETDVTFDTSEIGKWVKVSVGVTLPDGTGVPYTSNQYHVTSAGTQIFIINLTSFFNVGGLYKIGSVYVYDINTGSTLGISFTPMWCHELTLNAPVLVPCVIQAGFFAKSGSPISGASCTVKQEDVISAEVDATFSGADIGQLYSALMEIKKSDGSTVTISSPYKAATSTTKFIFINWSTPIPVDTYTITNFWIIDIYGNIFCGPITSSGGYCQNLTVSASATTLTTITISQASLTIGINGASQLTATCKDQTGKGMTCPTQQFVWSSDNTSIATVDSLSGLVTGVSVGTANITVKVGTIVSNKSVITVSATAPSLTSITISPESIAIDIEETSKLTAICKDQTGKVMICPSLIWNSDNIAISVVNEFTGSVTGVSKGAANITAQFGTIVSNKSIVTVSDKIATGASGSLLLPVGAFVLLGFIYLTRKKK